MSEKKVVSRNIAIGIGVICIILAIGLVSAAANYTSVLAEKDSGINDLNSTINDRDSQIANLQSQVSSLNSQITSLQSQVSDLTAIINMSKSKLKTLVFHVCEKGGVYLPDANYTYNQILTYNKNMYDVLLLPEYEIFHLIWTEDMLTWLTEDFSGIPIMLDVFGGGPYDYPVVKLTADQISEAMAVCDVRWLRISEVVSWYIEHNLPFPTDYVTNILNFCKEHNLKVQWNEWKVGDSVFQRIQSYIVGFEDIVTVTFSTNSGDLEPADGFILMNKLFQHWGGSVQAWYWTTRYGSDPLNMPISLLIQHALLAKNIGAEILQFEPYSYFFDNGEAKDSLRLLETMLA